MMSETLIEFEVIGDPVPQGNLRAFEHNGRVVTATSNAGKLSRWRGDIRSAWDDATDYPAGRAAFPLTGSVSLVVEFRMARPKGHYLPVNRSRLVPELRSDAPTWHVHTPDIDKLIRAVLDALTLKAWQDDSQVVRIRAHKVWSDRPGITARLDLPTP